MAVPDAVQTPFRACNNNSLKCRLPTGPPSLWRAGQHCKKTCPQTKKIPRPARRRNKAFSQFFLEKIVPSA